MWERVKFWGGPRAGEIVWVFFNAGASKRVALDGPWGVYSYLRFRDGIAHYRYIGR